MLNETSHQTNASKHYQTFLFQYPFTNIFLLRYHDYLYLQFEWSVPFCFQFYYFFLRKGNMDVFWHRESNVRPHKEEVTHITLVRPWGRSRYFMPCLAKWRNNPLAPLKERVNSALGITLKWPEKPSRQKAQSSLIGLKLNGS